MKINNPNINPKRPILVASIIEYNKIAKHLDGLGYTWDSKGKLITTNFFTPKEFPLYLYCYSNKTVFWSLTLDNIHNYNGE